MEGDTPAPKRAKVDRKSEVGGAKNSKSEPTSEMAGESTVKRKIPKQKQKLEPLKITDLNENCQLEVLSRMELCDLCSLAEVSVHFKELAQKFFSVKHRNIGLTSLVDAPDGKYSLLKVRQLLYNFGHLISSLIIDLNELDESDHASKLLTLIRKYSFDTIDELSFVNQPNERFNEYIISMLFGTELMARNCGPGRYHTRNKMTFRQGKSIQTQILEPSMEAAD